MRINAAMAVEMLKRQVEKKGAEYVYPRRSWEEMATVIPALKSHDCYDPATTICVNWVDHGDGKREADCILGHVYEDLGVLYSVPATVNIYGALPAMSRAGIRITARAQATFFAAQRAQDRGVPWGRAIIDAARYAADTGYDDEEYRGWAGMAEAF